MENGAIGQGMKVPFLLSVTGLFSAKKTFPLSARMTWGYQVFSYNKVLVRTPYVWEGPWGCALSLPWWFWNGQSRDLLEKYSFVYNYTRTLTFRPSETTLPNIPTALVGAGFGDVVCLLFFFTHFCSDIIFSLWDTKATRAIFLLLSLILLLFFKSYWNNSVQLKMFR